MFTSTRVHLSLLLALSLASVLMTVPTAAVAGVSGPLIVSPDARLQGATYAQWSARWWKWAFAIPVHANSDPAKPVVNPLYQDGVVNCAYAQTGNVWFLAGVISVSGVADRTCSIPSGTRLFFPVINNECSTVEPPPYFGRNEAELRACVRFVVGDARAEIDGVPVAALDRYRVQSPLFGFTLPRDNALGVNPSPGSGYSVADGIYLLLAPLPPGPHTIHIRGTNASSIPPFTLDITYHLTVVPRGHFYEPTGA